MRCTFSGAAAAAAASAPERRINARGDHDHGLAALRSLFLVGEHPADTGRSPRPGTPLRRRTALFLIRPPIRIDWPSSASNWVVTSVLFLEGTPSAIEPS